MVRCSTISAYVCIQYGIEVLSKAHKPADAIERYTPPEGYEVQNANIEWLKKMKETGIEFD